MNADENRCVTNPGNWNLIHFLHTLCVTNSTLSLLFCVVFDEFIVKWFGRLRFNGCVDIKRTILSIGLFTLPATFVVDKMGKTGH